MMPRRALACAFLAASLFAGAGCAQQQAVPAAQPALRAPDVPYEPSHPAVVNRMLMMGKVEQGDVVYDLGCGDGRIVIAAARDFGARGVCVDIDPQRVAEARDNARRAGVAERIRFLNQDLFLTDIGDANAVMLFLWPSVNRQLRSKLLNELRPGTRVVSHWHDMGDWPAERIERVRVRGRAHPVFLWTIPAR